MADKLLIPVERSQQVIYLVRGQKVMLDRDLAQLYGVETRVLNQAVRRNAERFPLDFMFPLTREEIMGISQFVTSSDLKFSKNVYAFTPQLSPEEYGALSFHFGIIKKGQDGVCPLTR